MTRLVFIGFITLAVTISCHGPIRQIPAGRLYSAEWFAAINDPNKSAWEILPQEKAGEVILSRREDGKTVVHDTHALRTLTKQKNDIQTTLRELPLDKLEKLGEMLAELKDAE